MGDVGTGSSTTKSNSPAVTGAVNTLAGRIGSLASQPGGTSYVAPSSTTTSSWDQALTAADNPAYTNGIAGAISSFGNRAAGGELGMNDPGYAALRNKVAGDTASRINTTFNNSGLFGSDSNMKAAGEGIAGALAGLDYGQYTDSLNRQTQAAQLLPQLFSSAQMPASVTGAVGAEQDASAQSKQLGMVDWLSRLSGALGGTAGAAGTTTQAKTPLWQWALGTAASAL